MAGTWSKGHRLSNDGYLFIFKKETISKEIIKCLVNIIGLTHKQEEKDKKKSTYITKNDCERVHLKRFEKLFILDGIIIFKVVDWAKNQTDNSPIGLILDKTIIQNKIKKRSEGSHFELFYCQQVWAT